MFAYPINSPFIPFINSLLLLLLHGCSLGWRERAGHRQDPAEADAGKEAERGLCPTAPTTCDRRARADARGLYRKS